MTLWYKILKYINYFKFLLDFVMAKKNKGEEFNGEVAFGIFNDWIKLKELREVIEQWKLKIYESLSDDEVHAIMIWYTYSSKSWEIFWWYWIKEELFTELCYSIQTNLKADFPDWDKKNKPLELAPKESHKAIEFLGEAEKYKERKKQKRANLKKLEPIQDLRVNENSLVSDKIYLEELNKDEYGSFIKEYQRTGFINILTWFRDVFMGILNKRKNNNN